MKKYFSLLFVMLFAGTLVTANSIRVQQVIYDQSVKSQDFVYESPTLSLGYSMYRANVFLANAKDFVKVSDYEHVELFFTLRDLISYNILDLLEYENDKMSVMNKYLGDMDVVLIKSDIAMSNLKEEMSWLESTIKHCESQKKIADKNYEDSIKSHYNHKFADEALNESKKQGQCISDAKIEYNAKNKLLKTISNYHSILKIKYDYLFANKYDIVENYSLIKSDLLEELLKIKHMITKYDL